ncbi:hypothetical protein ANO14919_063240 [Xylariales sp. No.14919]|nr:hypothetical protein ANO14919_063240 [Xylariales sp. No.14919]
MKSIEQWDSSRIELVDHTELFVHPRIVGEQGDRRAEIRRDLPLLKEEIIDTSTLQSIGQREADNAATSDDDFEVVCFSHGCD